MMKVYEAKFRGGWGNLGERKFFDALSVTDASAKAVKWMLARSMEPGRGDFAPLSLASVTELLDLAE